jgi:hypothetical protein
LKRIAEEVEGSGCLPDEHEGMSKSEIEYFERMCGKFEGFLINSSKGVNHGKKTTAGRNLCDL